MPVKEDGSSDRLLKLVFDTAIEPMLVLDEHGIVLAANQAFENLSERPRAALVGKSVRGIFPSEILPRVTTDAAWEGEVCFSTEHEPKKLVAASLRMLSAASDSGLSVDRESNGTPNYFICQLSGSSRGAALPNQQQKLQSLGTLAGSIAHDLNNILTSVLGHVSYLRIRLPQGLGERDSIVAIEDGARRAASMTQQILEFARGEESETSPVNLSLIVAAGINLLRASLPQFIAVQFSSGKRDIHVFGVESQLSQLVMNLLVNARDALPCGGTINASLSSVKFPETVTIENVYLTAGEYARLAIEDDGTGIPVGIRQRIFEPFFTTKNGLGTGLGLATVRSIVKNHKGVVKVDSEEGQGTCFEVLLPLSRGVPLHAAEKRSREVPRGNENILVVDDEESVRVVMQRSLEHLGYRVMTASNGPEAIDNFAAAAPRFALVIIDMIMPLMPGDELFYRLRAIDSSVPILIASGYSSDSRTKSMIRDGAIGFIQKPFAVEELAQEVRRCLDSSCPETALSADLERTGLFVKKG